MKGRAMKLLVHIMMLVVVLATAKAVGQPGEAGLTSAARFIDKATLAVVRVDIDGADTDALVNDMTRSLTEVVRETDPDSLGAPDAWGKSVRTSMKAWRDRFRAAGGREVYLVVFFNPAVSEPFIAVTPIEKDADTAALIEMLQKLPMRFTRGGRVVEGAIVTGDERLTKGMPLAAPERLEELQRAFRRAGEGAVQVALIPTDETRRAWAEQYPQAPMHLGGGPMTVLRDGIRSGWGSITLPPSWTFKLVAESESEEAAQQLAVALRKGVAWMAERAERDQPGLGDALQEALEPRAEGNLVVLAAGREKIERLKRSVAPVLVQARRMTPRVISASKMRAHVVGCLTWIADHEKGWPKDLETMVKSGYLTPEMLVDPSRPDDVPAYIYVRPDEAALAKSDPSKHAVLYENFAQWPKTGVHVAYADGHIELIKDEAAFRKVVEHARKHAAK